jgi:hypothetical protein
MPEQTPNLGLYTNGPFGAEDGPAFEDIRRYETDLNFEALDLVLAGSSPSPSAPETVTLTAGQNINAFSAVAVHADGLAYIASADNADDAGRVVGVAVSSALVGDPVQIQGEGTIDNNGFLFIAGKNVFLGINGALVQTIPSGTGIVLQPLGLALSASRLDAEVGRSTIRA